MFGKSDLFQKSKWKKLHEGGYHPTVEQIIEKINERVSQNILQVKDWERLLEMTFSMKDKTVLEIGSGAGWYIAEMIRLGAKRAIGIEIDKTIIDKSQSALEKLGLTGFEFHEITDDYFNFLPSKSVDLVYEMTVFQHILENITLRYMQETSRILRNDGFMVAQFLMNDSNPIKNPSKNKEGIMYYSHDEIVDMAKKSGLTIVKFANYDWSDGKGSYWRLYLFKNSQAH